MKILLVEDDTLLRNGVKEWLMDDGYNIESAENGKQALEKINNEAYDIVVLDLKLPDINGLQVFEQAKKVRPEVKGIVITAFLSEENHEKGRKLGISEYFCKPFEVTDLEKSIDLVMKE